MKKFLLLLIAFSLCLSMVSCASGIIIPDVQNMDVETAKTLLASKGLIPKVEYQFHNDFDNDMVIGTSPEIGSEVTGDTPVTLFVCEGPVYKTLPNAVGYMQDVEGIEAFSWGDDGKERTKGFYSLYVQEGYLYIPMYLCCKSKYELAFYGDFGTASINDTFDKTVPIDVIYDSQTVNNKGEVTNFEVKIPLKDLGVQKPTNIYIEFDFSVDGERQDFSAGFDLTWQD